MSKCSKIAYASRGDAVVAMRGIARARATRGLTGPQGAYLCSSCGCWHLTSKAGVQTEPWAKARTPR